MTKSTPSVPAVYMRGGTSKALFFHVNDIPTAGPARDRFLLRVMGSPDPMQIDGMGGTHIVTSKVAIISPSERDGVDVDYTFVQIGINEASVDYSANCGNISAGVGPFAIQEGLVKGFRKGVSLKGGEVQTQEIKIFNTGTKKVLVSHVSVDEEGVPLQDEGDFEIAGCPGTAAPILMDYRNVIGAALGKGALPTQQATNITAVGGKQVEYTVCDVANIIVFANAKELGIAGSETPAVLNGDKELIARIKELRGKAAQEVGLCRDWEKVDEEAGMLPMVALVSSPTDPEAGIQSRLFLDNRCHTSMAGTGAICTTACSRILGSVVNKLVSNARLNEQTFQIQHPLGLMPVIVETEFTEDASSSVPTFKTLSFTRTARRIWDGRLYVPVNVRDTMDKIPKVQPHHEEASLIGTSESGTTTTSSKPSGKASKDNQHPNTPKPTRRFAAFIHDLGYPDLSEAVVTKLKGLLLDHIGVGSAATQEAESSGPFIKAVKTLDNTTNGTGTVFANGGGFSTPYAALLNAALSHSLDFDDTHADGFLHPGAPVIAAALAGSESSSDATTTDLFTALAAGYEVTCRLGMALGSGGPQRGFHNTATAGIFGAVAAITKLKKSSTVTIENALGLALSKAAGSMQYLSNGSWNKRLHPGFAAHDAFTVVTLAEAGVIGAAEPFEGQYGLLNLYSGNPRPDLLNAPFDPSDLWFMKTSIKPYPACRLTHPQIETAAKIREQAKRPMSEAEHVAIKMGTEAIGIVGAATPNKIHPTNIVDAQFSSYYQTAVALLYGSGNGWKTYDYLNDTAVSQLLDKITIEADDSFGRIETTIEINWSDGTTTSESIKTLRGEPGDPFTWDNILEKFVAIATPVFGTDKVGEISEVVKNLQEHQITELATLIAHPTS